MIGRAIRLARRVLPLMLFCAVAHGEPWLSPGDAGVRHDIELLADAGIIHGPVTTWPISWPDIARDVHAAADADLPNHIVEALYRIRRLAREAGIEGLSPVGVRVRGATESTLLRDFEDSPRDRAEVSASIEHMTSHFAARVQVTAAADPVDGKTWRADGSYVGMNVGNFNVSAGWMERWWGPGWDSSLILSTNARPIPSLTLERNYTDPFESRLLSWIGPWRASIAVGETESDAPVGNVRFLAARVNIRPRPWLELGVTRTAQWCGDGRACDWGTFGNLLIGRDNTDASLSRDDEPGNQMAGYDMRLRSPWRRLPVAFHTQWIGEDEAGGLPSKFIAQFGLETWGASPWGSWRATAEYTDTSCSFSRELPEYNCAYRNTIYPQGYRYRGRIIGDPLDNDSQRYTLGLMLVAPGGDFASIHVRRIEINRDGTGAHSISPVPVSGGNVELRLAKRVGDGRFVLGLGKFDGGITGDSSDFRGHLTWQRGF